MTRPSFEPVAVPAQGIKAPTPQSRQLKGEQAADRDPRQDPRKGDIIAVGGRRAHVDFVKEDVVWAHWGDSFGAFHANMDLWRDWSRDTHVVKVATEEEVAAQAGPKPLAKGQKAWIAAGASVDGGMPQFLVITKEQQFNLLARKKAMQAADYFDTLCNRKTAITFDTFKQVYEYLKASEAEIVDELALMADM